MLSRISPLVVAAFLAASCSGTDVTQNLTQPTPTTNALAVAVSTTSSTVVAQPVALPSCPVVAPFAVPFVIVVQPVGTVSFVVTSIRLQFVDTSGMRTPQTQMPAPIPTTQFGTALDIARSAQIFPVTMGIGCGTGFKGMVQIVVETRDGLGRTASSSASVSVR
jgi:hypothetical protein